MSPKYLALIDVKKESISCLTSVLYHYENPCFCNDLLNVLILPNKLERKYKSNLYMVMLFHKEFATISLSLWSLSIVLIVVSVETTECLKIVNSITYREPTNSLNIEQTYKRIVYHYCHISVLQGLTLNV